MRSSVAHAGIVAFGAGFAGVGAGGFGFGAAAGGAGDGAFFGHGDSPVKVIEEYSVSRRCKLFAVSLERIEFATASVAVVNLAGSQI